jgi:hypothetical protein
MRFSEATSNGHLGRYATVDKNSTRFLLIWGREDDLVDPVTQSEKFLTALKQAGFFARDRGSGCGSLLERRSGRGARQLWRLFGPRKLRFLQAQL